jgi:PIN domain nuclease of toxin-antitoxin system
MRFLLDTHLLLRAAGADALSGRDLTAAQRDLIADPAHEPIYSVASLWEVAIKHSLDRPDFRIDPVALRAGLLENGYYELPIAAAHALAVGALPWIHKDPFDRLLLAQAIVEGVTLLTSDAILASYPGPVRRV